MKIKARMPIGHTLRDAVGSITSDQSLFVRRVMGKMDNWDCIMRLDITSNPQAPSYFVDELVFAEDGVTVDGLMPWGWYSGRTHQFAEIEPSRSFASSAEMSKYDVQCLLADVLGRPHPKPPSDRTARA